MPTRLDISKAVQAAAIVLRTDRFDRMPYIRLLKLLYIAERESLKERGLALLGDRAFAMTHGPVLSEVYDLIKGTHHDSQLWSKFIRTEGFQAQLLSFPGNGELSKWEIEKLAEVATRYGGVDDWDLVDRLHEELPEWIRNRPEGPTANPIPLAHILEAVGSSASADDMLAEREAIDGLRRLVEGQSP